MFGSFLSAQQNVLERIREEGNGFYAWGAVPGPMNLRHWMLMKPGDYVLCVSDNIYHYAARVLAKYNRIVAKLQIRVNSDFVLCSPRAASAG